MRRKRFSQEWVRSTTQRRARKPASRASAFFSSPRERMWAVNANSSQRSRTSPVAIGGVEAEPLRLLGGRRGPLDRDALERRAGKLVVVQVRARRGDPERDALALGEQRSFRPFLALSVGFGPVSEPPSGALPIAPSIASHSHSIPNWSS